MKRHALPDAVVGTLTETRPVVVSLVLQLGGV